jgi:2-amino-4-hydroxy-6-hydroxymethyldihydropteridine diphosphokinase
LTRAFIGLGSNLGDSRATLRQAIEALNWGGVAVVSRSSVYETDPVGGPEGQPDFLNQVIEVDTTLTPRELWERCAAVETTLGRARDHEVRWGPRTIDIDVLLYGDETVDEPDLVIPHPRIAERGFVVIPLLEIAPDVRIPGLGLAAALLAGLPESHGVRRSD